MGVSIPGVMREVGLDELADMSVAEFKDKVVPAAIAAFADGDMAPTHDVYTGEDAKLYGETLYTDGRVAQRLGQSAIEAGSKPGELRSLQGYAAAIFSAPQGPYGGVKTRSIVKIMPGALEVDKDPFPLARAPEVVVELSACLYSRSVVSNQMHFGDWGREPFVYIPFTRSHFTNQVILRKYDASKFGEGMAGVVLDRGQYKGQEDGDRGVLDLLNELESSSMNPAIADVILATNTQHSTRDSLMQGLLHSHRLMRTGGTLVLRGFVEPTQDEFGIADLQAWAYAGGFDEDRAIHFDSKITSGKSLLSRGHDLDREMQTVVVRK